MADAAAVPLARGSSRDWLLHLRHHSGLIGAVALFLAHLRLLPGQAPEGIHQPGLHPERQRGLRPRAPRHGADGAGADGRARPLGRRGDDPRRLHREPSRRRLAGRDRLRHPRLHRRRRGLRLRQRLRRRLRPHPADHRDAGDGRHLCRLRPLPAADAGRQGRRGSFLGDDEQPRRGLRHLRRFRAPALGPLGAVPVPLVLLLAHRAHRLGSLRAIRHRAHDLRHRLGGAGRLHVGPADRAGEARGLHDGGPLRRPRRALHRLQTSSGNADIPQAGAYTLNSIAAVVVGGTSLLGGTGSPSGRSSAPSSCARSRSTSASSTSTRCCSRCSRESSCSPPSASRGFNVLRLKNRLEVFR